MRGVLGCVGLCAAGGCYDVSEVTVSTTVPPSSLSLNGAPADPGHADGKGEGSCPATCGWMNSYLHNLVVVHQFDLWFKSGRIINGDGLQGHPR